MRFSHWFCFPFLLVFRLSVSAQDNTVEPGKKTAALDEPFSITLVIQGGQAQNTHSAFPDIQGMRKRDVALTTSKQNTNGKNTVVQRITQNYMADKEGKYVLNDFAMTVNGRELRTKGMVITVIQPANPDYKLLADSALAKEISSVESDYADTKQNAFFALGVDKAEVFVGEGFTASLALYIADNNPVELQPYQAGKQLVEILKKLKPGNCWEEDFHIREFQPFPVTIKGRKYTQYKMFQATFYPFNADTVVFPQAGLTMLIKKTSGIKEAYQTFYSAPKILTVKELPPHPLRDGIAVGTFRLEEFIARRRLRTGKGFYYQFKVTGEGNLSAVTLPAMPSNAAFDFFPPESKTSLDLTGRRVAGSKTFQFYALPKEPGIYPWAAYFRWIYFNVEKREYDTLASGLTLRVGGGSLRNQGISASDLGGVYDALDSEDNRLRPLQPENQWRRVANILVLVMLGVTLVLILWRGKMTGKGQ